MLEEQLGEEIRERERKRATRTTPEWLYLGTPGVGNVNHVRWFISGNSSSSLYYALGSWMTDEWGSLYLSP